MEKRNPKADPTVPGLPHCSKSELKRGMGQFQSCIQPQETVLEPPATRLSSFFHNYSIRKVGVLKIDAQGSDFKIVRDVMERSPEVKIDRIIAECQKYEKAGPSRQIYASDNDCLAMERFVKGKYPNVSVFEQVNNCAIAEYNFIFDFVLGNN